ncbi:Plasma membrane-associated cation-binding protein 1 [Linum perenne]
MGYWKTKVLPKIKKVFEKDTTKKAAAAEATKSFDSSKEEISKEFEDKKAELQPKVLEVYEASSAEIKTVVKEPTEAGLKKHSASVVKFVEELVKIDFPGSKVVSEACSKFGPAYVSGPVSFIFEKVATFIPAEEAPAAAEATASKEKEIVIEEASEKKEEAAVVAEGEKAAAPAETTPATTEPAAAATTAAAASAEEPPAAKVEKAAAATPEAPKAA